jgi:N4-gp56 family major capsid protein
LTPDLVFVAVAKLREMNTVPIDNSFVAIVHPNVAADLMRDERWQDVHKYATPENIYMGEIGMIGGVRFVQSTEAKIIGGAGDGCSVYATMFIGSNAYGVTDVQGGGLKHIIHPLGSGGTSDPLDLIATTGWKCLKTAERLVEEYMVRVEHACRTNPDAASN